MEIAEVKAWGVRLVTDRGGSEAGHAYLYFLRNDLHKEPFALLEDVHVNERFRGIGVGTELVQAAMRHARNVGCYKLIATSRDEQSREHVHDWYQRLGFQDYGTEFRINL